MVEIIRDTESENEIKKRIKERLSTTRTGIHVSDLISPRLTFLRKKYGVRISDEQAMYFIVGRSHHSIVQSVITSNNEDIEKKTEFEGIIGSIDYKFNGHPVEFKTTRVRNIENVPDDYVEQLRKYCCMENDNVGYLVTLYLNAKDNVNNNFNGKLVPIIIARKINFTNEELEAERQKMRNELSILKTAIETGNGFNLPKCADWKCRDCLYKKECEELDKQGENIKNIFGC